MVRQILVLFESVLGTVPAGFSMVETSPAEDSKEEILRLTGAEPLLLVNLALFKRAG